MVALLFLSCLQPHGRDESLITRKMWKHILIQGLYQMFWLFFFMYAAPVLFEQYRITDNCTFVSLGPDENNAGMAACAAAATLTGCWGGQASAVPACCVVCALCDPGCDEVVCSCLRLCECSALLHRGKGAGT